MELGTGIVIATAIWAAAHLAWPIVNAKCCIYQTSKTGK
jgi:hypothetical protein